MKLNARYSKPQHFQTRYRETGSPKDADSYQKLLEAKDRIEAIEGIRRGLDSMKRNAGQPAEQFFEELFREKGIAEDE